MGLSCRWMAAPALDSDGQASPLGQRRWAIATLLFLATLLNYLDRQVLSLVSPVLRRDFGLTATGYSHIVTAFLLGYALTQLFAGRVIDRVGPRLSLLVAMLWWWPLCAARLFVFGVGGGGGGWGRWEWNKNIKQQGGCFFFFDVSG